MRLPEQLRHAIEAETRAVDAAALKRAAAKISECYRSGRFEGTIADPAERAAYLVTRLPATYAANAVALSELAARVQSKVSSLLDLGAGPGTSMWGAAAVLPQIERFTAVERDGELLALGRRLASHSDCAALRCAEWVRSDIRSLPSLSPHDVIVMSYAAGELADPLSAIETAWELADVALVLVEPGTPKAFQTVLRARDKLIEAGAVIAAPCPHHSACPLAVRDDWCHFSVRVERTAEHRRLKAAELGYEDEKFSYIIATRSQAPQAESRVVRHPLKHPGHVKLTLCTPAGLQTPTIGKSKKGLYRAARKVAWGDEWSEQTSREET